MANLDNAEIEIEILEHENLERWILQRVHDQLSPTAGCAHHQAGGRGMETGVVWIGTG